LVIVYIVVVYTVEVVICMELVDELLYGAMVEVDIEEVVVIELATKEVCIVELATGEVCIVELATEEVGIVELGDEEVAGGTTQLQADEILG
jgi:hypothetical protein